MANAVPSGMRLPGDSSDCDDQGEVDQHRDDETPEQELEPGRVGQLSATCSPGRRCSLTSHHAYGHSQTDGRLHWGLCHLLLDRVIACCAEHPRLARWGNVARLLQVTDRAAEATIANRASKPLRLLSRLYSKRPLTQMIHEMLTFLSIQEPDGVMLLE
jgi:hypothetical protein